MSRPTKFFVVLLATFSFVAFIGTAVVSIARGPGASVFGIQIAAKKTPTPKPSPTKTPPRTTPTPPRTPTPPGMQPIVISGNATGTLRPGVSSPIALTFTNPNNQPAYVSQVVVTPQSLVTKNNQTVTGCNAQQNVEVVQNFTGPKMMVPANGSVSVANPSTSGPIVRMKDTGFLQDACKGATFHFTYSAQATSQ